MLMMMMMMMMIIIIIITIIIIIIIIIVINRQKIDETAVHGCLTSARPGNMVMHIRTVMVNHAAGQVTVLGRSTINFSAMIFWHPKGHQWCKLYIYNTTFFLARDIDECYPANQCHQNAACNNTKGSYNCTCKGGRI